MPSIHLRRLSLLLLLASCACLAGRDQAPHAAAETGAAAPTSSAANTTLPPTDANSISAPLWPGSVCPKGPFAALPWSDNPVPKAVSQSVDGADWSEGPVWLAKQGLLLFGAARVADDDAQSRRTALYTYNPTSATLTPAVPAGVVRSNGLSIDASERIWAASHQPRGIVSFDLSKPADQTTLTSAFENKDFDAPNDLVRHTSGGFFFTDTTYEQAGRAGQPNQGVYFVSSGGQTTAVDLSRNQPNGIALSLDQTKLYVGGLDKKLMQYPVSATGMTGQGTDVMAFESNIDGMAVDCAGNLYLSLNDTKEIAVLSAKGEVVTRLKLSFSPSNMAFGGDDLKTLFITGQGGLYMLQVAIPGLPS